MRQYCERIVLSMRKNSPLHSVFQSMLFVMLCIVACGASVCVYYEYACVLWYSFCVRVYCVRMGAWCVF